MASSTLQVALPLDLSSATLDGWITRIAELDRMGWPMVVLAPADPAADPLDPLAIAAFCVAGTGRIALCVTIDPDTVEPFTLARGLATLDHLSGGRCAWRLAAGDAARSAELVAVTRALMLSWKADALVEDIAGGLLSLPDRVAVIGHEGEHFLVEGPLNIPRPPQGAVPLIALPGDTSPALADLVIEPEAVCTMTLGSPPPAPGAGTPTLAQCLETRR